jgi:hypothetical protein
MSFCCMLFSLRYELCSSWYIIFHATIAFSVFKLYPEMAIGISKNQKIGYSVF